MGTTLRMKFRVISVTDEKSAPDAEGKQVKVGETVHMEPVYGPAGTENAAWAKATPSGKLLYRVDNPQAFGIFRTDQEVLIDLVSAT